MWIYIDLLVFFAFILFWHLFEFLSQGFIQGKFDRSNLLISIPYLLALAIGIAEYFAKDGLLPAWRAYIFPWSLYAGVIIMLIGQIIRSIAIIQAGSSFTHDVQEKRRDSHRFVSKGIYAFSRHPAYLGWYIWALGSQILLANPFTLALFAVWGWRFLNNRIKIEEQYLISFFGEAYKSYKLKVPSRLPFIK